MQFTYEAKDTTGKTVTGALDADSERAAASLVREMGYFPMRFVEATGTIRRIPVVADTSEPLVAERRAPVINEASPYEKMMRAVVYPIVTGVSLKDLSVFYQQLSAMVNAGVPLHRSISTIEEQTPPGALRRACRGLHMHILEGGKLSEGMAAYPHIFSNLQIEFVASSELTGGLGDMMNRLAAYLESEYRLRQMVQKETLYPKILFALSFMLPNLVILIIGSTQAYLASLRPLFNLIALFGLCFVGGRYALQSSTLSYVYDTVKSYIPYFGKTVRMLAIAKFSRAMASLYAAGVQIPTAMEISARVSGNQYLSTLIHRAVVGVKSGDEMATAFRATGVFPPMFISLVHTGEETGNLDSMLDKAADFYEGDAEVRLHQSVKVLTTLLFLVVAGIVGFTVVKFYTGMFNSALQVDGN
jgi:type IV pilus assembly protein PilC